MNIPTFKIKDSDGNPSNHEAVHIVYVRELMKENEALREAGGLMRSWIGDKEKAITERWDGVVKS